MPVKLSTVRQWCAQLDANGLWMRVHTDVFPGPVELCVKITCELCGKFCSLLRKHRNFSRGLVDGIGAGALKLDNCKKHAASQQHQRALELELASTVGSEVTPVSEVTPGSEVVPESEVMPGSEVVPWSEFASDSDVALESEIASELEVMPESEVTPELEVTPVSEVASGSWVATPLPVVRAVAASSSGNRERMTRCSRLTRYTAADAATTSEKFEPNKNRLQAVKKMVDVAYTMCRENAPFRMLPALLALEQRHGVDLGGATDYTCSELVSAVGETMAEDVGGALSRTPFFSVICDVEPDGDGGAARAAFHALYVDGAGETRCRLLRACRAADTTAVGIERLLVATLASRGVADLRRRLVGVAGDARPAWRDLVARLRESAPWLVGVDCLSHRLDDALREALAGTYFDRLEGALRELHALYRRNPSYRPEVLRLAQLLERHLGAARGRARVSHVVEACRHLLRGYAIVVRHLEAMRADGGTDGLAAAVATATLRSFAFVSHALLLARLLEPVVDAASAWQRDAVETASKLAAVARAHAAIAELEREPAPPGDELAALLDGGAGACFRGVALADAAQGAPELRNNAAGLVARVAVCVRARLDPNMAAGIVGMAAILDTTLWPLGDASARDAFCVDAVACAALHFRPLLEGGGSRNSLARVASRSPGGAGKEALVTTSHWSFKEEPDDDGYPDCSGALYEQGDDDGGAPYEQADDESEFVGRILAEWTEFKRVVWENMAVGGGGARPADVWPRLAMRYSATYPRLAALVNVLRAFPASPVATETCRAEFADTTTDWRASMPDAVLEHIVRIRTEGAPPSQFDAGPAATRLMARDQAVCGVVGPSRKRMRL